MFKGFTSKKQTQKQYITNLLKSSRAIYSGFDSIEEAKWHHSKMWFEAYAPKVGDYSLEELLNPERKDLVFRKNCDDLVGTQRKVNLAGYNGVWRLVLQERPDKSYDFTIGATVGNRYRFHPEAIQHGITTKYGDSIYKNWKRIVMQDINSLVELIEGVKSRISAVPWSYTCCESSANLCETVGITTYRGAAFLFPESYS
jgi:hypothetical protein